MKRRSDAIASALSFAMYTDFSNVYDHLMRDVDYTAWAERYFSMLKSGAVRVTECACGTGSITLVLKEKGLMLTGIDLSDSMLAIAMNRARAAGLSIPFVKQDMRKLTVPRRQDAVLATCDGVNYLTDEGGVKAFFTRAHEALKPGGQLLFDVSSAYKLENTLGNNTLTLDEEDCAYIWHNRYDEKKRLLHMELTIFSKDASAGDRFIRISEAQTQRAHTREELTAWLTECGFKNISVTGSQPGQAPKKTDERLFFSAEKAE